MKLIMRGYKFQIKFQLHKSVLMDLDDDGNMVDSANTSYEGNINALNSVNIHRIRTYMPRSSSA